jgi:hypothetical protein
LCEKHIFFSTALSKSPKISHLVYTPLRSRLLEQK